MIDIYAMHFNQNGSIQENKTLIQTIPARTEGGLYLIGPKIGVKVGSAESFDFSIQPNTKYYDSFIQMRTYFSVEYDGDSIFYGRVLTIETGFMGEKRVKCEGAMAFFNDSYYPGTPDDDRPSQSAGDYITDILNNHNSQLNDPLRAIYPGEIPGHYSSAVSEAQRVENATRKFGQSGWAQTKSALDDIVSHYGGMFRIRKGANGLNYLDAYKHYYKSSINSQIIEVGKNLLDMSSITEVNNIFTVVIPIGKGTGSDTKVMLDETYFPVSRVTEFYSDAELNSGYHLASDYRTAESRYGRIIKPQEFNESETKEELLTECAKWVKENYQGGIDSFTITAIDLHQIGQNTEKIMCGDRVIIRYPVGSGRVGDRTLTCTAVTYDLYNPENNSYTFGIPASSLNKSYSVNSTKSKQDADETPKPSYGGGGNVDMRTEYQIWWDSVCSWLKKHQVWYRHNHNTEGGPNSTREMNYFVHLINDYILDDQGEKKWLAAVWVPQYESEHNVGTATQPRYVYGWSLDGQGHPRGYWARITRDDLNNRKYNFTSHHLLEYIYAEYGVDLTKKNKSLGINHDMPEKDDDILSVFNINNFVDPETGLPAINVDNILQINTILDDATGYVGKAMKGMFSNGFSFQSLKDGLMDIGGNLISRFGLNADMLGKLKDIPGYQLIVENGKAKIEAVIDGAKDKAKHLFFGGDTPNSGISIIDEVLDGSGGSFLETVLNFSGDGNGLLKNDMNVGNNLNAGNNVNAGNDVTWEDIDGTRASAKELKRRTVNTETEFGSLVDRYFTDPTTGEKNVIHTYEFTQAIEEYKGGPMVVSKIDGDLVYLGSEWTDQMIAVARKEGANIVGIYHYETDPTTGYRTLVVDAGGGMRVRKTKSGVTTEVGVYDADTLTGGVMVEKLNDNTVTTHIKGNRIIVGTVDDQTAQTMQEKFGDLDGLVATKATIAELNAAKARISSIESDYINTTNLSSRIANIEDVNVKKIHSDRGSAIFHTVSATNKFIFGGTDCFVSLGLRQIQVVSTESNQYKLQYKTYADLDEGNDWQDAGTFSRATALSDAWRSGTITVTASPQGNKLIRTLVEGTSQNWDGTAYDNGNKWRIPITSQYSSGGSTYTDITGKYVYVDASATISTGSWSNGKVTATAKHGNATLGSGSITMPSVTISADSWSNGQATIHATHGTYTAGTNIINMPNNVSVTAGSWSNGKCTATAKHGTATVGSGSITMPSVTISADSWSNGQATIHATHGTYTAGTNIINMPSVSVAFSCTDLGNPTYDSQDPDKYNGKVVTAKANHGTSEKGSNNQIIWLTSGSFSDGRAAINARMTDKDGALISRAWISLPATASFTYQYISSSVGYRINCTVGGKTYTTTHAF